MHTHILKQVRAKNNVFGDTCARTVKYLEAEYTCKGKKIQVSSKFKAQPLPEIVCLLNHSQRVKEFSHWKVFPLISYLPH